MLCIAEDDESAQPFIWIHGGHETVMDYLMLAISQARLSLEEGNRIIKSLEDALSKRPDTPVARLLSVLDEDNEEALEKLLELAQITVSTPIHGLMSYSTELPSWKPKSSKISKVK